jgi:choline dehydrogenase
MGNDASSVVTPRLEVRGVHGLRIADASVMPSAIRGHTHAPSMVIGAKAVELMTSQQPTGNCERDRWEFT